MDPTGVRPDEYVFVTCRLAGGGSIDLAVDAPGGQLSTLTVTFEQGGANKVGPNLWDIVNRPIASHEIGPCSPSARMWRAMTTFWISLAPS